MYAHKVIDTLRGRDEALRVGPYYPAPELQRAYVGWMDERADMIAESQVFVFENIPFVADGIDILVPGATDEEKQMFLDGLLPLPFPICWLETWNPQDGCSYCYRSAEHTSELQSLMRISYAVFCLKTQNTKYNNT